MNKNIRAIIIDDEQSACNILSQLLIRFCPDIIVVDIQNNVEDGVESIKSFQPDVVFLDIQMPKYAGFEIVSFFPEVNFEMIFVTAYDNYAVKAFELSAVDYLLKPIEIDKLQVAVERLRERIHNKSLRSNYDTLVENLKQKSVKRLVIPLQGDQKIVEISNIIAIEASESYSQIHTNTERILVSKNLKHFERALSDSSEFFRVHKSWLININAILGYSKGKHEIVLKGELTAKLSKLKKAAFEKHIKNN